MVTTICGAQAEANIYKVSPLPLSYISSWNTIHISWRFQSQSIFAFYPRTFLNFFFTSVVNRAISYPDAKEVLHELLPFEMLMLNTKRLLDFWLFKSG